MVIKPYNLKVFFIKSQNVKTLPLWSGWESETYKLTFKRKLVYTTIDIYS